MRYLFFISVFFIYGCASMFKPAELKIYEQYKAGAIKPWQIPDLELCKIVNRTSGHDLMLSEEYSKREMSKIVDVISARSAYELSVGMSIHEALCIYDLYPAGKTSWVMVGGKGIVRRALFTRHGNVVVYITDGIITSIHST